MYPPTYLTLEVINVAANNNLNIAVVGAGIIGSMTAWQLSKQGHRVTVYEQWNSPNDQGASAGESRIFRTAYKEGSDYVPMLLKSKQMWDELQTSQDRSVLQMCGGLTIGRPDHADVKAVIDCAEAAGLDYHVLDAHDMASKYPQYRLDYDEVGVYDPLAGIFRPELAVLAARDESKRLGSVYRPYTRVRNIRPLTHQVVVDTAEDSQAFDKVIVATGPWANELCGPGFGAVQPKRLVAAWFPAHDVPLHTPESMPISIRRHHEGGFSCFPVLDGSAVKILPHHLPWNVLERPEDLPRFIEPEFVREVERVVARLMPGLDPTAVRVSTWTEGFTVDGAPLVGPAPGDDRVILATGMSGQGFKFSPMIGSIIADFVDSGASPDAISIMNARRFSDGGTVRTENLPVAAARQ
jgi:sarcosine oxidase